MPKPSQLDQVLKSDIWLAFLMINIVGITWVAMLKGKPLPTGFDVIVVGVFAGKTIHSVAQSKYNAEP